ncbi:hypothetical protein HNY73_015452 [Argiope bruennichi]|uniref:Peptidase aspartic putative domain-containing protein n=1 Tax=Argiope bruennichi TaxID=94029 RepID=A0A8T0ETJ6_ARGBR|nr:hypothetical protein HNY73_015452 [Argiope bruennichi]
MLSHGLLGGSETNQKSHNVYNITLQSSCSNFRHNISVLDEKKICGAIPRVSNPEIFPILKRKNIELSDTGEDTPEIDLLIGADYLGVLLTGSIEHIDKNLVAIKTKLGWALQGKQTKQSKSLENIIYVANLDLTELWSLDAIGIRDSVENKSRQVADEETVEFFRIHHVSIYDSTGFVKSNGNQLYREANLRKNSYLQKKANSLNIIFSDGKAPYLYNTITKNGHKTEDLKVYLLSLEDGKQQIVKNCQNSLLRQK